MYEHALFLQLAVKANHVPVVRCLLDVGGASVHVRNHENGNMPMHDAAAAGHTECVQVGGAYGQVGGAHRVRVGRRSLRVTHM